MGGWAETLTAGRAPCCKRHWNETEKSHVIFTTLCIFSSSMFYNIEKLNWKTLSMGESPEAHSEEFMSMNLNPYIYVSIAFLCVSFFHCLRLFWNLLELHDSGPPVVLNEEQWSVLVHPGCNSPAPLSQSALLSHTVSWVCTLLSMESPKYPGGFQ